MASRDPLGGQDRGRQHASGDEVLERWGVMKTVGDPVVDV
jgi:hypothetical protein